MVPVNAGHWDSLSISVAFSLGRCYNIPEITGISRNPLDMRWKPLKKLGIYLKDYHKQCILGPLFKLLEASFELMVPLVVARLVDAGIGSQDRGSILNYCLILVGLGAVGLLSSVTAQWFAASAAVGFATRLRRGLMEKLMTLSCPQLDSLGSSTLLTRLTSDVNQVQSGLNLTLRLLLRSPFVVFGAMLMAFTIDSRSALIFLAVIPVLSLVVFGIMLITMPMYKKVQQGLDRVTTAVRENLSGVRVLRAFRKEAEEIRDFQGTAEDLSRRQLTAGRISALLNPMTFVIINLAIVILIRTGALQVQAGILTQGLVIALYNYMSQILVELIKLANLIINMTKAAACAGRIQSVLELSCDQQDGTLAPSDFRGSLEFKDLSFSYAGAAEPSLEHISLTVAPGTTLGIIGSTGSGKSTLASLLPRLYDATEGQLLVDGRPIEAYSLSFLRSQIGMVAQNPQLFRGTIRSNLLWGNPEADDSDLAQAMVCAQAEDILKIKGRDGEVEQAGLNLSGGQRQRLTIARALVRRPRILILDDAASALDYATDARLRRAIRSREPAPTTLIVSQRAAAVQFADRILVLDDGHMEAIGTHGQLLASCPLYGEICRSQGLEAET